jgi:hypothetical protein
MVDRVLDNCPINFHDETRTTRTLARDWTRTVSVLVAVLPIP